MTVKTKPEMFKIIKMSCPVCGKEYDFQKKGVKNKMLSFKGFVLKCKCGVESKFRLTKD